MQFIHDLKVVVFLSQKINVLVRFTIIPQNINSLPPMIKLVHDLGMDSLSLNRGIPIKGGKEFEMLSPTAYKDALETALKYAKEFGVKISSEDPVTFPILRKDLIGHEDNIFAGCAAGISYIHINSRGDVFPCPYLPIKIGSIKTSKLSSLLENQHITEKFYDIRFNLEGRCGSCKYLNICGGCRASAFSFTDNIQGSDPMCLAYLDTKTI
jgi:radical SAM protein with 4Fe4S-binding SPASM domain